MILGCKPVQVFMIARHGTRYPEPKLIPEMKNLLQLRDQIVRNHEERKSTYFYYCSLLGNPTTYFQEFCLLVCHKVYFIGLCGENNSTLCT